MKKLTRWALCLGLVLALTVCCALADESPAVKVQLDGQDLAFTDAVPQVKSQRTFLPFRAVFEAMGAEVGWEGNIITAVRGDKSLTMTLDQPTATLTQNGKTTTITMDVAPYVDPSTWRTYVPVRFAAQAFGCAVGWDGPNATAIIVDIEKLEQECKAGRSYTYLEQSHSLGAALNSQPSQLQLDYTVDLLQAGQSTSAQGVLDVSAQGEKMSMDMTMNLDQTGEVKVSLRGDRNTDKLYMNVGLGGSSTVASAMANTWYELDLTDPISHSNRISSSLLALTKAQDVLDFFPSLVIADGLTDASTAYASLRDEFTAICDAFADENFLQEENTYTAVYESAHSITDAQGKPFTATYVIVLERSGDQTTEAVNSIALSAPPSGEELAITMALNDQGTVSLEFDVTLSNGLSAQMEAKGTITPATDIPATTPPEGATILPLAQLLSHQ